MSDTFIRESPSGPLIGTSGGGETGLTLVSVRYVDAATPLDPANQTGSDEAPFATLQQAIDSIAFDELDNATIFVVDGDYGSAGATYAPIDGDILQIVGFGSAQNLGELVIAPGSGTHTLRLENLSESPSAFDLTSNATGGTYEILHVSFVGDISAPSIALVINESFIDGNVDAAIINAIDTTITGATTFATALLGHSARFQSTVSSTSVSANIVLRSNSQIADALDLPNSSNTASLDASFVGNGINIPSGTITSANNSQVSAASTCAALTTRDSTFATIAVSGNVAANGDVFTSLTCSGANLQNITATDLNASNTVEANGCNVLGTFTTTSNIFGFSNNFINVVASSANLYGSFIDNLTATYTDVTVTELVGCKTNVVTCEQIRFVGCFVGSVAGDIITINSSEFDLGAPEIIAESNLIITNCDLYSANGVFSAVDELTLSNCRVVPPGGQNITLGGTVTNTLRIESTILGSAVLFDDPTIAALVIDTTSFYAAVNVGLFGSGGTAPVPAVRTFIDPPLTATLSITVPAVAAGAVGYATTSLVGNALEGVFTAANQPVIVNPQANLVVAGAGGGFVNARIAGANSLVTTFLGPLAGGAANFTITRAR